jgi:hypothetical protein
LIVLPDGHRDDRSAVYWLQSDTLCGDIRCDTATGDVTAFAGRLKQSDDVFCWQRELANGYDGAPPDEGRLAWHDGGLRETGVHSPYVEHWTRIAMPQTGDYAVSLTHAASNRSAFLLRLGGFLFHARGGGSGAAVSLWRAAAADWNPVLACGGVAPQAVDLSDGNIAATAVRLLAATDPEGSAYDDWTVTALGRPRVPEDANA